MQPPGEDLDGDGVGAGITVSRSAPSTGAAARSAVVQQVEVDHHAALVEVVPADDDVEPVVVRVPLALRGGMPGMTWKARTARAVPVSYTALLIR